MNLSDVKVGAIVELPGGDRGRIDYVTHRLKQFEVTTPDGRHVFPYDQGQADHFTLVAPPAPDTSPTLAAHEHVYVPLKDVDLAGVGRVSARLCVECKHVSGTVEIPFEAPGGTHWQSAAREALRKAR